MDRESSVGKIFGVGLSRTGTGSLNAALEILGYRAWHFPIIMQNSSAKARRRYRMDKWMSELFNKPFFEGDFVKGTDNKLAFDSRPLNEWDAATDLPVARFFRQLDVAFPGSKFILTVRDEDSWLESCRNFFSPGAHRIFKWQQLHYEVYGANEFDESGFRGAMRKHVEDVRNYFMDRQDDFIELNIVGGEGWEKLCHFLGKDIPNEAFPKRHVRLAK